MTKRTQAHVLNILRKGTVTWYGRGRCLKRYSEKKFERVGANGQDIFKLHYNCGICKGWFRDVDEMEVDHIDEVGSFKGDFNEYVERMYCNQENLMAVCIACHKLKTGEFNSANNRYERKKL